MFLLLMGASTFTLVFRGLNGVQTVHTLLGMLPGGLGVAVFAAGVEAEHGLRARRRRQQQFMQIASENLDRLGFRRFARLVAETNEHQIMLEATGTGEKAA